MASKHSPYFNLLDALRAPGCALCRVGQGAVKRFLEAILYESVVDIGTQRTVSASHGLCPTHSEQLVLRRDTLGTAILYNAILGHLLDELPTEVPAERNWLGRLTPRRARADGTATDLAPHATCPACRRRDEAAARAVEVLGEHDADPDLTEALRASGGLCVPHLRQALPALDGPALQVLLARQRAAWQELRAQLAELIRKNDYRFRDEGFGEEADAWQRAVRATAGEPGVF